MISNISSQDIRLRKLDTLVGTKVSVHNVSVQTDLIRRQLEKHYGSKPNKAIDIMLTSNIHWNSLRGTSLSIILTEYHSESSEKSPMVLEHDWHLSGLRLARFVDLSLYGLEAVVLVLTSEEQLGGAHDGRKKGVGCDGQWCYDPANPADGYF